MGNVTNEEVANINPKFQELISLISGRTLEQLAKEIGQMPLTRSSTCTPQEDA